MMISNPSLLLLLIFSFIPLSGGFFSRRYFCSFGVAIGNYADFRYSWPRLKSKSIRTNPYWMTHASQSTIRRTRSRKSVWHIGDRVMVKAPVSIETPKQHQTIGIIRSINHGWYTVQVEDVQTSIVKCRSSQLHECSTTFVLKDATEQPPPSQQQHLEASIINLDEYVRNPVNVTYPINGMFDVDQLRFFQTVNEWVVFTDLHCSPHTIETCEQVLLRVHSIAQQRNAGILFLGDFWHIRSHSIRIDCLNRILNLLQSHFTQPMILIPGNHDQITSSLSIAQNIHSLAPLQTAYRICPTLGSNESIYSTSSTVNGILIFSQPTIFMNSTFIPYIRNPAILERVLFESSVVEAKAVFCHVDVTGASMNDNIVSKGGISISSFPANIPIYSGHFHNPHNVTSSVSNNGDQFRCVQYLGSPYQVSLSEAHQEKFLVVLNAASRWQCLARLPIFAGRRHFRPKSLSEFLALQVLTPKGPEVDLTDENENDPVSNVKSGDRVVLSMHKHSMDALRRSDTGSDDKEKTLSNALDQQISVLRNSGVLVEIREVFAPSLFPDVQHSDDFHLSCATNSSHEQLMKSDMTASSLWASFLSQEAEHGSISRSHKDILLCKGKEILDEIGSVVLDSLASTMTTSGAPLYDSESVSNFQLHVVTVQGFGPFSDKITYPLFNRGLVLVRGFNKDGGSDSNGSGKTSLAMSILWALTGSIDPRPSLDGKVSDVVNDSSKAAVVTVQGSLNGVDFVVTRTKTQTKGSLSFVFNGDDISRQSIKDTQDIINEKLGICSHVLARTMFHGQHALNDLLGATDNKLKDELSLVVPLSLWQEALVYTRQKVRATSKRLSELDGMITVRCDDASKYKIRLEAAESSYVSQLQAYEEANRRLKDETATRNSRTIENSPSFHEISLTELDDAARKAGDVIMNIEKKLKSTIVQRDTEVNELENVIERVQAEISLHESKLRLLEEELNAASLQEALAKERISYLQDMWKLDLISGVPSSFHLPHICPTCMNPIPILSDEDKSASEKLEATVRFDLETSLSTFSEAHSNVGRVQESLRLLMNSRLGLIANLAEIQSELGEKRAQWHETIHPIETQFKEVQKEHLVLSSCLTSAAKQVDEQLKIHFLENDVVAAKQALDFAAINVDTARNEWNDCQQVVTSLNAQKECLTHSLRIFNDLCEGFGPRGIQAFVMQDTLSMLESSAQAYLDELSDGSQRLELSLDSGDCIARRAYVRGSSGDLKERPLSSLSGGQWRRCSLALALAFADLVSNRANFRPSICVFDEPLLHLDQAGRSCVGRVLRTLLRRDSERRSSRLSIGFQVSTILIILQDLAADELEESFDCIDEVVKEWGTSTVLIDH